MADERKKERILQRVVPITAIVLLLVGGVVAWFLWGRGTQVPQAQTYAVTAWQAVDRGDTPESLSYMHYSQDSQLASSVEKPDLGIALVPSSGYVYLVSPTESFDGLEAVFLTESGRVASVLSYSELESTWQATGMAEYLDAANYIAYLYIHAHSGAVAPGSDDREGQWYRFTDSQLTQILSAQ